MHSRYICCFPRLFLHHVLSVATGRGFWEAVAVTTTVNIFRPPPRSLRLLPSLRFLCGGARSAKIAGMSVSGEAHYQRMASIQQSMHQR